MAACERCWGEAYLDSRMFAVSQVERYRQRLEQISHGLDRADDHAYVPKHPDPSDNSSSPGQPAPEDRP